MITITIHAFIKKKYLYALAWLGLTISSVFYHSIDKFVDKCHKSVLSTLDKLMIILVIIFGMYEIFTNTLNLQSSNLHLQTDLQTTNLIKLIIPVVAFISVGIIYITNLMEHHWVHLISILGHHSILLAI